MINFANAYRLTLPIVATTNLIMATTLLLMSTAKRENENEKENESSNILSILFLSAAMFILAIINYAELFIPVELGFLPESMSIVVFAASLELFLLFYASVSLLDQQFVSRKGVIIELLLIFLFTLPPVIVPCSSPVYWPLFGLSILFYLCKFSYSFYIYKKYFRKARQKLLDFYSEKQEEKIQWINNLFYMIVIIGTVSIIIPFTDYTILTFYNIFVAFAYFYMYIEVLRHEFVLSKLQPIAETDDPEKIDVASLSLSDFPAGREALLKQWIDSRAYTQQRITIEDVARELNTNRTTLSLHLNSNLQISFYEWISQLRMEEAKNLLVQNPKMSVLEIATQVGIDDRSNFDKTFKRIVGMSPAVYRKMFFQQSLEREEINNGLSR